MGTARKPLIIDAGQIKQLPSGDYINVPINSPNLIVATNDNASSITIGQAVYLKSNGAVDLAKANAAGTSRAIGIVFDASISAAASGSIATDGVVVGLSGLTAGSVYYLSEATAGLLTTTAPSTAGQFVQKIGTALSTTSILVDIEEPIVL